MFMGLQPTTCFTHGWCGGAYDRSIKMHPGFDVRATWKVKYDPWDLDYVNGRGGCYYQCKTSGSPLLWFRNSPQFNTRHTSDSEGRHSLSHSHRLQHGSVKVICHQAVKTILRPTSEVVLLLSPEDEDLWIVYSGISLKDARQGVYSYRRESYTPSCGTFEQRRL